MNEWKVDQQGWLAGALADLRAGNEFSVVMSLDAAQEVFQKTRDAVSKAGGIKTLLEMMGRLAGLAGGATFASVIPEAQAITGMLAALGALGAMEGSVMLVAVWAHFKFDVTVGMHIPKGSFDPSAVTVRLTATRPASKEK